MSTGDHNYDPKLYNATEAELCWEGNDLILVGPDGQRVHYKDAYFKSHTITFDKESEGVVAKSMQVVLQPTPGCVGCGMAGSSGHFKGCRYAVLDSPGPDESSGSPIYPENEPAAPTNRLLPAHISIDGWTFHVGGLPDSRQWEARWPERQARAWFDELGLNVTGYGEDPYRFDTSYIVPTRVVDILRKLQHAETPNDVPAP